MAMESFLFTSESVNEGHPDKLADQVGGSCRLISVLMVTGPISLTTDLRADMHGW